MAKRNPVLTQLTTAELKRLLVARERIDILESEKSRLLKELVAIDRELDKLLSGKPAVKKTAAKKTRKKTTRKKTAAKSVAKGAARAGAAKKTRGKKTRKKVAKPKAAVTGRVLLEDVIVAVIGKNGGAMPFKDLHKTIVKGKLFKSKSANFDNVLRRTLSTSTKVKRVGRGIYDVA